MTTATALQWLNLALFLLLGGTAAALFRAPSIRPWATAIILWAANNVVFYLVVLFAKGLFTSGALNEWSAVTKLHAVTTAWAMLVIASRGRKWTRR